MITFNTLGYIVPRVCVCVCVTWYISLYAFKSQHNMILLMLSSKVLFQLVTSTFACPYIFILSYTLSLFQFFQLCPNVQFGWFVHPQPQPRSPHRIWLLNPHVFSTQTQLPSLFPWPRLVELARHLSCKLSTFCICQFCLSWCHWTWAFSPLFPMN